MKCQKRYNPEEKRKHLATAPCSVSCGSEFSHSSQKSFFNYSMIKNNPLNYELDSNPILIEYTFSTPFEFSEKQDLTMKYPEIYPNRVGKYSETQEF